MEPVACHVQKHVGNIWRLNRPRSSSSGRYAGVTGHVITSAYNGCAVEMIKSMCADIPWFCVCALDWIQCSTANVLRNGSFVRLLHWNYIECLNVCFALIRLSPLLSLSFTVCLFLLSLLLCGCVQNIKWEKKTRMTGREGEKKAPGHSEIPVQCGKWTILGSWMFPVEPLQTEWHVWHLPCWPPAVTFCMVHRDQRAYHCSMHTTDLLVCQRWKFTDVVHCAKIKSSCWSCN